MYRIIPFWNLLNPDKDFIGSAINVNYRGYNAKETFLTSQLVNLISRENISFLSVSDISNKKCTSWRNLYYKKGKNDEYKQKGKEFWGKYAGRFTQDYITYLFDRDFRKVAESNYDGLIERIEKYTNEFKGENVIMLEKLRKLATNDLEKPEQFINTLKVNAREELAELLVHLCLSKAGDYAEFDDVTYELDTKKVKFLPNPIEIGINKPATPDFFIEKYKVVGDIKTGIRFEDRFVLTCAGYALSYENWSKEDINWGMIYFLPTRIPIDYAKILTDAQVYLFPIDDILRSWFLRERDEAYSIISKDEPPDFPNNTDDCHLCNFIDNCIQLGLQIS